MEHAPSIVGVESEKLAAGHSQTQAASLQNDNITSSDSESEPESLVEDEHGPRTCKHVLMHLMEFVLVIMFLYFFLVALDLLGSGMQVMLGDNAASLFGFANNPLAGLCVGLLCTVLVQSSSTTTSIVVTMVGAGALTVEQGIYFIFGANIGTSVTNSIVCFSFINNPLNYSRGFAAATVHDMFNLMNVALWFPIEWISDAANGGNGGVLYLMTEAMTSGMEVSDGEKWESPFKTMTKVITDKMIQVNKNVIKDYAQGRPSASQCSEWLCTTYNDCSPYKYVDKRCSQSPLAVNGTVCDGTEDTEDVKAKFDFCANMDGGVYEDVLSAAQAHFDAGEPNKGGCFYPMQTEAGIICFVIALVMMFTSMILMVKFLNRLARGSAQGCIKKALNTNGYLGILIGTGVTMLVQSSSITTATLTPMAALGLVSLENMLPLTLGANIGTTVTGLLAAMVSDSVDALQIALVHLMFNVFGVLLFYPIPPIRRIPLRAAAKMGEFAYVSKVIPLLYVVGSFIVAPTCLLCLSLLFTMAGVGGIVAGSILSVLMFAGLVYFVYWFKKGGNKKLDAWMSKKYANVDIAKSSDSESDPATKKESHVALV